MSNNTIQPIQTAYNGYLFRSRLEARWALFWDLTGIKYEYEKEGYDLGDLGFYLPDFWLPESETWVEIKGQQPTELEIERCKRLCDLGRFVYLIWGPICEHTAIGYAKTPSGELLWTQMVYVPGCTPGGGIEDRPKAMMEARRARFEYDAAKPGVRYEHRP